MKKEKVVGYGYVGRWGDGTLGWFLPMHLSSYGEKYPAIPSGNKYEFCHGELAEKCKITIEPLKNKNGKPIRRRIK